MPPPEPEKLNEYVAPGNPVPTSVPYPFVIVIESAAESATQINIIDVRNVILFMGYS
jgi:hypothetical protein